MRRINLLFTVWSLNYGGAERFVLGLIKHLDKSTYNITVFSDSQNDGPMRALFEKAGAKIILSNVHRFKHPIKYKKQLKRIMEQEEIDIVHANDDLNMIFPLLAKPKDTIFIAHSHNTVFRFTSNPIASRLSARLIMHLIASRSDYRLSCSDEAGKSLFGKRSYKTIHNGIDLYDYKYDPSKRKTVRGKMGIPNHSFVILNVGRLAKEKNQIFLVKTFSEYFNLNNDSYLIIIGDGSEKRVLADAINESGLTDRIFLLPAQSDIACYYSASDIFIMPSLFEGMPLVTIEAQANGLKCIFSDSITREANHIGNADFYSLDLGAKKWAELINGAKTDRAKVDYGKMSKYDVVGVAKQIDSFYKTLIGERQQDFGVS